MRQLVLATAAVVAAMIAFTINANAAQDRWRDIDDWDREVKFNHYDNGKFFKLSNLSERGKALQKQLGIDPKQKCK